MRRQCGFILALLLACPDFSNTKNLNRFDTLAVAKYSQYHCSKQRTCLKDNVKICGFDEETSLLAEFKDRCNFHKTNCQAIGMYREVDMQVCDAKKAFENETFEFEHVQQVTKLLPAPEVTTPPVPPINILNNGSVDDPTRLMGIIRLVLRDTDKKSLNENLFAQYSCVQMKPCSMNGEDPVCAIDYKTTRIAKFSNICLMYYANCNKLGAYLKLAIADCQPHIHFDRDDYKRLEERKFVDAHEAGIGEKYFTTTFIAESDEEFDELTTTATDLLRSDTNIDLTDMVLGVYRHLREALRMRRY